MAGGKPRLTSQGTGDQRACSALMFRQLTDWTKCACSLLSFIGSGYTEFDNNARESSSFLCIYNVQQTEN